MQAGEQRRDSGEPPAEKSFWDSFDRELAEINATLDRLAKGLPSPTAHPPPSVPAEPPPPAPRRPHRPEPRTEETMTSPQPMPPPDGSAAQPPAAAEPAAPVSEETPATPTPMGTDLGDPKNFGLMPPVENLEPGPMSAEDYRKRLSQDLAFANKVLHTSRVPASVWREWRAFEKAAYERLRALTGQAG